MVTKNMVEIRSAWARRHMGQVAYGPGLAKHGHNLHRLGSSANEIIHKIQSNRISAYIKCTYKTSNYEKIIYAIKITSNFCLLPEPFLWCYILLSVCYDVFFMHFQNLERTDMVNYCALKIVIRIKVKPHKLRYIYNRLQKGVEWAKIISSGARLNMAGPGQAKKGACRPLVEMHLFITVVCITWHWLPKAEAILNISY